MNEKANAAECTTDVHSVVLPVGRGTSKEDLREGADQSDFWSQVARQRKRLGSSGTEPFFFRVWPGSARSAESENMLRSRVFPPADPMALDSPVVAPENGAIEFVSRQA